QRTESELEVGKKRHGVYQIVAPSGARDGRSVPCSGYEAQSRSGPDASIPPGILIFVARDPPVNQQSAIVNQPSPARLVLFVEDDSASRRGYAEYLSAAGYEVQEAATGEAALTAARTRRPDVIVLDL